MGVQSLQVIYDSPTAVFMPGQTVSGRILIGVSSKVKIRSVKLKVKGEAKNSWTEQESRRDDNGETQNYSVKYDAEEEYFENKSTIIGGGGESYLEEGEHVYPFSVSLPLQLPSSFNGEHGHVRYTTKVVIDIPWGKDKEQEKVFEVISPLNLNDEPSLAEPKKEEKEKFYCCFCCKSGPLTLVACIPYTGFVPGQTIPLTIELDNNSNVAIEAVKIKLERELSFKARHPTNQTKTSFSELAKLQLQGIEAHASKTWTEQMTIPNSLIFSNLKYCSIIADQYLLKVEAVSGSMHENTEVKMKLFLGNIPLTVAQGAPQFGYPAQPTEQSYPSNGQFSPNTVQPIGFIEPTPNPGFVPQVSPHGPSLYPQTQDPNQSQFLPSNVNVQQPAFNPMYQDMNSEVAPTAPSL